MDHEAIQKEPRAVTSNKITTEKAPVRGIVLPPVTGVMPPLLGEAMIREVRPTVVGASAAGAALGEKLTRTIILAPLAWALMAPLFFKKIMPFICKRYTLTNRRLMIQRGLKPKPVESIDLADIDEVRLDQAGYNAFYLSGTLEIVSKGVVKLKLFGVPEPESFRRAIINACSAWVPGKAKLFASFIPASAAK